MVIWFANTVSSVGCSYITGFNDFIDPDRILENKPQPPTQKKKTACFWTPFESCFTFNNILSIQNMHFSILAADVQYVYRVYNGPSLLSPYSMNSSIMQ